MQRKFILILSAILLFGLQSALAQANDEMKNAEKYFAEKDNCNTLSREQKLEDAEKSCRAALVFAEKLPASRGLEKYSAYRDLGLVLLLQRRSAEAIQFFNKSLEAAKTKLDDTDADTGLVYFFLGQANHMLGKIGIAREFYTKAEKVYRTALVEVNNEEMSANYPKWIKGILEAHLKLLEDAKLTEEAKAVKLRLEKLKEEFSKFF